MLFPPDPSEAYWYAFWGSLVVVLFIWLWKTAVK